MKLHLPAEHDADAWQIYIWNLPENFLSQPQKLQFMLMLEAAFNAFDPFVVVGDLLRHRDLWEGAVMDRAFLLPEANERSWFRMGTDLIKLRDVGSDHWNVDTLFILTAKGTKGRWKPITKNWAADEVGFIDGPDVGRVLGSYPAERQNILTVWWD
jgi:hypothetical protein